MIYQPFDPIFDGLSIEEIDLILADDFWLLLTEAGQDLGVPREEMTDYIHAIGRLLTKIEQVLEHLIQNAVRAFENALFAHSALDSNRLKYERLDAMLFESAVQIASF